MEISFEAAQVKRARMLALTAVPVLAGLTVVAAMLAVTSPRASEDDAVSVVVALVACCALARLTWLSGRAALELHRELGGIARASEAVRDEAVSGEARGARSRRTRTAGLFLAIAAATVIGAQSASAETPAPRPSFSMTLEGAQPGGDGASAAAESPAASPTSTVVETGGAALFTELHRATSSVQPVMPEPFDADPMPTFVAPTATADDAPRPGWTPGPLSESTALSPVILGPTRTGQVSSSASARTEHVVLRGDTLWGIAASHLHADARAEEIAAALPQWLEANPWLRSAPDSLDVGERLTVPTSATAQFGAHR